MVRVNVLGAAYTARAALPALAESTGHLLITGSVAGRYIRNASLYSVTKWAVTGMAGAIREEAVGTGVRVTLVQPGITDTGILSDEQRKKPKLGKPTSPGRCSTRCSSHRTWTSTRSWSARPGRSASCDVQGRCPGLR